MPLALACNPNNYTLIKNEVELDTFSLITQSLSSLSLVLPKLIIS